MMKSKAGRTMAKSKEWCLLPYFKENDWWNRKSERLPPRTRATTIIRR